MFILGIINIILEKSAFNKQIPNEMPFPYSNIKTHLYFTSSIKKPVKIISDEGKRTDIITNPYGDHESVIRLINGVKSKSGEDLGIEDVAGGSFDEYRVGSIFKQTY